MDKLKTMKKTIEVDFVGMACNKRDFLFNSTLNKFMNPLQYWLTLPFTK